MLRYPGPPYTQYQYSFPSNIDGKGLVNSFPSAGVDLSRTFHCKIALAVAVSFLALVWHVIFSLTGAGLAQDVGSRECGDASVGVDSLRAISFAA